MPANPTAWITPAEEINNISDVEIASSISENYDDWLKCFMLFTLSFVNSLTYSGRYRYGKVFISVFGRRKTRKFLKYSIKSSF
jgi:hypothetical protein